MSPFSSLLPIDRPAPRLFAVSSVLGFVALVVVAVLVQGRQSNAVATEGADAAAGLTVVTHPLRVEPGYMVRERYVGRVESRRASELGFVLGGLLREVRVEEGDAVEEGQVLALLDSDRLEAVRRELEAQVVEIEARLALARLNLERTHKLVDQHSASKRAYDEARFEEKALVARLAAARAGVERVAVDLDRAALRAPFAGRIVARSVDEGVILAPGAPVLQLVEVGAMEMRVGVSPEMAAELETGSKYPIDVAGERVTGEILAVLDEVAADTRTVTAILSLDTRNTLLRHGALARLVLESRRDASGYWLPIAALTESRRGLWAAFVVVPEPDDSGGNRVERREVSLLHTESDRAFVRGTLRDGESVVVSGVHRLVPDQLVEVEPEHSPTLGMSR